MTLPADITKRETIKNYIQEAVKETKDKQLAELRLKNIFESIKESEEALEITLPEFKEGLKAALDYDKVQSEIDKRQSGIDLVDTLGVQMGKLQKREIKGNIGNLEITNQEILCEATNEWFNDIECFFKLFSGKWSITFPNGVEVPFEQD